MKNFQKTRLTVLTLALALALAACGKSTPPDGSTAAGSVTAGSPNASSDPAESAAAQSTADAPSFANFTATDINGNEIDQSIFADHDLTMVNIWATFCGPCLNEMPELGELNAEYAGKNFQVIGIVVDVLDRDGTIPQRRIDDVKDIVEKVNANYTHLLPSDDLYAAKLSQVTAVPETVFIDKDGNIVGKPYLGARSKDKWASIIEELLTQVQG